MRFCRSTLRMVRLAAAVAAVMSAVPCVLCLVRDSQLRSGGWEAWHEGTWPIRVRLSGYSGCLCDDCVEALELEYASDPYDIYCIPTRPPYAPADKVIEFVQTAYFPGGALVSATACFYACGFLSRRTTRSARNRCPACAYPLAGLPSPICPECGCRFADSSPPT